ncbi:ABC transporter substrate-binding protein [Steroidobacter sp. S1-65]|uniref:ABC transporter substrate-binding protein n=1 Tax=Steroidobacter gossypii TaxID=2805490 RepID=A0ABS1X2W3_9GAMM|nr:ABC transporter substrate-binding protein [Steroidobacter gossypii]MBM0107532.1 ABC transporter substrate-binding protein [Steroidobacter gossypii]
MKLRLAALMSALLFAAGPTLAADRSNRPMRIVSLNMCVDSIVIDLVSHDRIAALSHYARDPQRSTIAEVARHLPITYETAEEVVALRPDLVLTSRHSAIATRNALQRVGIRFELFDVPGTIAESLAQVRQVARLLGAEREGEVMVARIEAALDAARLPPDQQPLTAAVYQPGGLSAGANTVVGELMELTGLQNIAARYGVTQYRPLPLEVLVASPPDVLLVGETSPGAPLRAEKVVTHRALRALESQMSQSVFPARLLYCAGPTMIESAAALVRAREHAHAAQRRRVVL